MSKNNLAEKTFILFLFKLSQQSKYLIAVHFLCKKNLERTFILFYLFKSAIYMYCSETKQKNNLKEI